MNFEIARLTRNEGRVMRAPPRTYCPSPAPLRRQPKRDGLLLFFYRPARCSACFGDDVSLRGFFGFLCG
jgi:hypothetical protein